MSLLCVDWILLRFRAEVCLCVTQWFHQSQCTHYVGLESDDGLVMHHGSEKGSVDDKKENATILKYS